MVDAATQTVTAKGWGSAPYMAPETWRSEHATPTTDIYSLGVLDYELATLVLPYDGATREAFRDAHLSAPVPHPRVIRPDLDPRLDALIVRMMAKAPARRPQNASEVAATLDTIDAAGTAATGARHSRCCCSHDANTPRGGPAASAGCPG